MTGTRPRSAGQRRRAVSAVMSPGVQDLGHERGTDIAAGAGPGRGNAWSAPTMTVRRDRAQVRIDCGSERSGDREFLSCQAAPDG